MAANRNLKLVVGALVALGVGYYLISNRTSTHTIGEAAIAEGSDSSSPANGAKLSTGSNERRPVRVEGAEKQNSAEVFEEYRCPDRECGTSPFFASSADEAVWMRANGYPSQRQRESAKSATTAELRARFEQGDPVDIALYGERLATEGDRERSLGILNEAVKRGSIYALYSISDVYGTFPEKVDPLQSRAFIRAAYLAGDNKASIALAQRFQKFTSAPEQVVVDRNASRIHRNFFNNKVVPRPG